MLAVGNMKKLLLLLSIFTLQINAQTISFNDIPSIGFEYEYKTYRYEINSDFKSFDIILSKVTNINKYCNLVSGIGYNKNVFVKINLENSCIYKKHEFRIEPSIIFDDSLDWELVLGIDMFEFIVSRKEFNIGLTITLDKL